MALQLEPALRKSLGPTVTGADPGAAITDFAALGLREEVSTASPTADPACGWHQISVEA